jgi:hypothetical protein
MPSVTSDERVQATVATAAQLILAASGSICVLALFYFVYRYGWSAERHLSSWSSVFVYYGCPTLFAALFFASLRLPDAARVRLALLTCSTVISLYAAEALLTVWIEMPSVVQRTRLNVLAAPNHARGLPFDMRSPQQVVDDLRSQGLDAVRSAYPTSQFEREFTDLWKSHVRSRSGREMLPLSGISNKLTVLCNEAGQYVTFRSDEHGFNNPPKAWSGPIDIAAVGDSYVQGWCVPTEASFVSLIRQHNHATVNLGNQGDGPLSMLATIKEYAALLKPKIVLWFYFENDFNDLGSEKTSPLFMQYLTKDYTQRLFDRQPEVDKALAAFLEAVKVRNAARTHLAEVSVALADLRQRPDFPQSVLKLFELRSRLGLPQGELTKSPTVDVDPEQVELFYRILVEAKETASQWGGHLHFVFLPSYGRYASGPFYKWPGRDDVLRAATRAGLPITDLHPIFVSQENPMALFPPARYATHYNEAGHRLVAEAVLRDISARR